MSRILLVEDDPSISKTLKTGLEYEDYIVSDFANAENALEFGGLGNIDIALLDVRLPGMDGFTLCRSLREHQYSFPIIMLTARDEEIDKVLGLEMGADDYMVKPYSFRELLSRIRAHLRRVNQYQNVMNTGTEEKSPGTELVFGNNRVDTRALRVFHADAEVDLTPIELRILLFFLEYESQSMSREQIIGHVWGENYFLEDIRTVDVHIRHLREKIEDDPSSPRFLQTVRGHGYRFVKNP